MIEIGEWVRTKKGNIGKFKFYGVDDEDERVVYFKGKFSTICVDENEIIKHSKNIIDLIEVGDVLKIDNEKYEVIYDDNYEKLGILRPNEKELSVRHSSLKHIFNKNGLEKFKTINILTKEQFSQNSYEVEE